MIYELVMSRRLRFQFDEYSALPNKHPRTIVFVIHYSLAMVSQIMVHRLFGL